jgi:hypothetical protein
MRRKQQKFESVTREFRHIQDKDGVNLRGNTCWHKWSVFAAWTMHF